MVEITKPIVANPKKLRSKLSNGSKLLPMTDGRSATARRFKDLVADIESDLGGADLLSTGERQLVRRAAFLSAEAERLEAMAMRDERVGDIKWRDAERFDLTVYGVFVERLGRIFDRLGLQRRPKPISDGSDALVQYFQSKPNAS